MWTWASRTAGRSTVSPEPVSPRTATTSPAAGPTARTTSSSPGSPTTDSRQAPMTTPPPSARDPADQAMHEQRDERARQLLDHLGRPVRRALDIGCGRGEALTALALR